MKDSGPAAALSRAERDRFVAFAFAAADLLLEVDASGKILFAAGALKSLTGQDSAGLVGRPFYDLLGTSDRPLAKLLLRSLKGGGRLSPITVRLAENASATLVLGGCRLPTERESYQLTLTVPPTAQSGRDEKGEHDPATGLLTKDSFARLAKERLTQAGGDGYKLSLVAVDGIGELRERADQELAAGFLSALGRHLRAQSANGDAVGQLAEGRYGVIHRDNFDADGFRKQLAELAAAVDPKSSVSVASSTLELTADGLSEADSARTVLYALNTFSTARRNEFTLASLSDGFQQLVAETATRIRGLRGTLDAGEFSLVYQPIVALEGRGIHHYEALARFPGTGPNGASPAEMVAFAERLGVIADFDLAVCERAVSTLEAFADRDRPTIAINISGRSLEGEIFAAELHSLVRDNAHLAARLMFEITESAHIERLTEVRKLIDAVRDQGFRVCLDDFGAGAASFHYLHNFAVDFVKIDGLYIRNALESERDRAFLKAMASLCQDLGTASIAEMIETEPQAAAMKALGIGYGQGYLFGRPGPALSKPQQAESKIGALGLSAFAANEDPQPRLMNPKLRARAGKR
jgi:EAL domain-containing protein (putative c-di-GMP-specific phosphodiesterase class I)